MKTPRHSRLEDNLESTHYKSDKIYGKKRVFNQTSEKI